MRGTMRIRHCGGRLLIAIGLAAVGFGPLSSPARVNAAAAPLPAGLNFGLGNNPSELGWMTSSGVPWKFRYAYLSAGVNTGQGWETWDTPAGQYATYYMNASQANGYIPVFTYYELLQSNPSTGNSEA